VQRHAKDGADVIKIFASGSIREGGKPTLSQDQLNAICSEAKKVGLRTVVHAYGPSVRMASLAGCTQVEHGLYATDEDLRFLAERGTYFDPQAGLVIQNYLDNKSHYLGIGNYTEAAFDIMQKVLPEDQELFRHAIAIRGLKVVFGTDAVAGAHGLNAEEFLFRVQTCGQDPMAALVSANSLAAEAMGLQDRIGSIAPGLEADIIALDGDPLKDITATHRVVFVMKSGKVAENLATGVKATGAR
jgi:imidazolonepropionase-like amidohydrolase